MPTIYNKVVIDGSTLMDISDTTAIASDVGLGKEFYTASGAKAQGTAVIGNAISVVDATDTNGGTVRTITSVDISDTTAVAADVISGKYFYTANGTKTLGIASGGSSTPSATTHTIYFEFSDNTNITLTYYDDESTFISSAIRETTPTTYGGKTVTLAQLDGTTWYELSQETWETLYNGTSQVNPDTPYNLFWVSSMSEVYPIVGSVWRITIDNIEYRCVAVSTTMSGGTYATIGNPKYSGGTDDGTETPFSFYNAGWGAWVGDTELTSGVYYNLKIERLVTT